MNRGGLFLLILSAVIAVAVTWLNSTWLNYKDFIFTQKVKKIDYYLSNFTLLDTQADGSMRYLITAQHLIHQQSTNSSEIFKPLIQARDSDDTMITLKAEKAVQDKNGIIKLIDDVSITKKSPIIEDNFELKTHDLIYNPNEQKLSSKSKVLLNTYQVKLSGVGFSSNLNEQELRIHSNVQSQFIPAK